MAAICAAALLLALAIAEFYFRNREAAQFLTPECRWVADDRIGFAHPKNQRCVLRSAEFSYQYRLNADGHPDVEYQEDRRGCTIMAVGDSHTLAVGVTDQEAWPNVAEKRLQQEISIPLQVINMGVSGYSLGQEYLQAQRYFDKYSARHVLIGFSLATDTYDIRTPEDGGFIYGSNFSRTYFDIQDGRLVTRSGGGSAPRGDKPETSTVLSSCLDGEIRRCAQEKSALARALARGHLGQHLARLLRGASGSSWASAESVVATQLSPVDAKSWKLVELILEDMKSYFEARGAGITVVVIPYLPQVYPEVWERVFGSQDARYSRFAGNRRMAAICARVGIECIDATDKMIETVRVTKEWLHYPQDAHPNAKGQRVIGELVASALRGRVPAWCTPSSKPK